MTTLKTVSMYLRAAKTEAEDAGESTEGMADSVSDLREEILSLTGDKVDIQIDEDTFKSTYQILKELSEVWGNLSDISQANLLELLGGKRNANVVSALLENFSVAEDVLKTSMDSTGSALAENEKYLDSIEGHIANFKASFEDLSTTLIDSELAKGVVDIGTGFMNVLVVVGNIINALGGLQGILVSIAGITAIKHAGSILDLIMKLPSVLPSIVSLLGRFTGLSSVIEVFTTKFSKAYKLSVAFGNTKVVGTLDGISNGFRAVTASASAAQLAIAGVFAAIGIGIAIYQHVQKKQQEAIDNANELISTYNDVGETYESNAKSLEDLRGRFEELSNGVDQNGNNISLTSKQYAEYLEIIDKIVDISPDICSGYDSEGRAILNYKTALDDAIASQNEWLEREREIYLSSGKDIFDGKQKEWARASNDLSSAAQAITQIDGLIGYDQLSFLEAVQNAGVDVSKHIQELIDNPEWGTSWFLDTDAVMQMYENYDHIINNLRAMKNEDGGALFNADQISEIRTGLMGLAGAYSDLKAIESEQIDYLTEWSEDQSWYDKLSPASILAFTEALEGIHDPTKSFEDNKNAVSAFGAELADALGNDAVKAVVELSKGLEAGTITYDDYIAKIEELKASWEGLNLGSTDGNVWLATESYLIGLGAAFENVTMSAEELKAAQLDTLISGTYEGLSGVTERIEKLGEVLTKLQDGSLGVSDVLSLLEEFPDLATYVDITADGFGNLDDGLRSLINSAPKALISTLKEFRITKDLTDQQAESLDNLIDYLEDLPSDSVKNLTEDFGALGDAINGSNKELTELEEALSEDDHDARYEDRVKYLAQLKQVIADGEIGSKAYAALTEYFGLEGMSVDQVKSWIKEYSKFFTEGEQGYKRFLSYIEKMNKAGVLSEDFLSYDSKTGLFSVDATMLEEAAAQLGMNKDVLLDLIQKVRMYIKDFGIDTGAQFDNLIGDGTIQVIEKTAEEIKGAKDRALEELQEFGEGGTVDLTLRPKVDTSELIEKGWGDVDKTLEPGSTATVFTQTYSNEEKTKAINFTPIFVNPETGKTEILTPEELDSYAESVLAGGEDYKGLQIGAEFTGEDAIDQAVAAAEQIHLLQEIIYAGGAERPTYLTTVDQLTESLKISANEIDDYIEKIKNDLGIDLVVLDDSLLEDWDGFNTAVDDATEEVKYLKEALSGLGFGELGIEQLLSIPESFDTMLAPLLEDLGWSAEKIDGLRTKWEDFVKSTQENKPETDPYSDYNSSNSLTQNRYRATVPQEEETTSVTFVFNVNGEEVTAEVDLLVSYLEEKFGADWEVKLNKLQLEAARGDAQGIMDLLDDISRKKDTKVIIKNNFGSTITNLKNASDYLDNICSKNGVSISVVWSETGAKAALGTTHAKAGNYLLGEEYSSTGTPKPELVVSQKDGVYLAGVNGPEVRKLNAGDVVYNNSETEEILSGNLDPVLGSNSTIAGFIEPATSSTSTDTRLVSTQQVSAPQIIKSNYVNPWDVAPETTTARPLNPWDTYTPLPTEPEEPEEPNEPYNGTLPPDTDGGSGKQNDDTESGDFESRYKKHQHMLAMEQESQEEYLKWLDKAYKDAYANGEIELEDYRKYCEEVFEGMRELFEDQMSDIDHQISMLENRGASSGDIINLHNDAMTSITKEIEAAIAQGYDENGEYIQNLQSMWWDHFNAVADLNNEALENSKDATDELVEYRIDMIKQELEAEKDALNDRLDAVHEFYDEQRELLQDARDEEKYQDEQKEKRDALSDLEIERARLENDDSAWAQKRKLELDEEIEAAKKDLDDFEKDHALDEVIDKLDKQEEAEEKRLEAEIEAIDKKLNDPHALFNQALNDIKNNTAELYQEFIEYNRKHGTGNDEDIKEMWENAYITDLEYRDTHNGESLNGIQIGNYTGYEKPTVTVDPVEEAKKKTEEDSKDDNKDNGTETTNPYGKVSEVSGLLQVGSRGNGVKALQYALNQLGYGNSGTNSVDGVFGSQTRNAVIAFQRAMGIQQDGVVGKNTKEKFKVSGYASGTLNALPGLKEVDELGPEWLFVSPSTGQRYRVFSGGEKVLNAEGTNFLYNFAMSKGSMITDSLQKIFRDTFSSLRNSISGNTGPVSITTGDVIVQGNADTSTVSELRRAQRDQVSTLLKEFGRLRK